MRQHLGNGHLSLRVLPKGGNFCERHQDKTPFMKPGVGNLELREIQHLLTEEENIQVKGPRTPADLADTAEPALYLERKIQQFERAQPG